VYAASIEEAQRYLAQGYEPVECSFGAHSVVGPLVLDHHGQLSHEVPVSIKAAKLALGHPGTPLRTRFVVAGMPDADAVYTVLVLSRAVLPDLEIATALATLDRDPIGIDRTQGEYIRELLFEMHGERRLSLEGFSNACRIGTQSFDPTPVSAQQRASAIAYEARRISDAARSIEEIRGLCAFVVSDDVGRDIWHREAPVFLQYKPSLHLLTVSGCTELGALRLGTKHVFELLGPAGLASFYPVIDTVLSLRGSGGRPDIGGSPRGAHITRDQAWDVYLALTQEVNRRG
jgi:hypothetical protein